MLAGRTALVVEQEFLIALDIQRMLESLGAGQVLFARSSDEALQTQEFWRDVAVAILELRPAAPVPQPLLEALDAAGIPIVFATAEVGAKPGDGRPVVVKPIPEKALASAVVEALANRS